MSWALFKKIQDDLTSPIKSVVDTLADRLTAGRASNLDNLNTSITSRQPDVLSSTQANRLDTNVGSRQANWGATTTHRDRINTTISSRSSHTAADVWSAATRTLTTAPSAIKSVQRGSSASSNQLHDVSISSVVLSKTFVNIQLVDDDARTLPTTHNNQGSSGRLTSSTNLRILKAADSSGQTVAWEVIEFA